MAPAAALSAFLNNTPVVAVFVPAIKVWARRNNLGLSKLLIPLSYASIAGGTCTLIGTSTNLVVNGLRLEKAGSLGLRMFDLAWIGLPITASVFLFVWLLGGRMLHNREVPLANGNGMREYTTDMMVEEGSPLEGCCIEGAGLRSLPGLFLAEIERDGVILPAVEPRERLAANDRLVFVGAIESVVDLHSIRGLVPATDQISKLEGARKDRSFFEAVLSDTCPLVGKRVREGRFRTRYRAAIIALARNGERLRGKIGDMVLHAGDTLLLEARRFRKAVPPACWQTASSAWRRETPGSPLVAVFTTTALLTAFATNNVAAVLAFPIALSTANHMNVDIISYAVTIMVAASASFATPIGYQTNLMVYNVGGYRFGDFVRIGVPLTLLVGLVTVGLVPLIWEF